MYSIVHPQCLHPTNVGYGGGKRLMGRFRHFVDQKDNVPSVNPAAPEFVQGPDNRLLGSFAGGLQGRWRGGHVVDTVFVNDGTG
jgi:hypothetical protein